MTPTQTPTARPHVVLVDPMDGLVLARSRFTASVARFRTVRADAWSEWATARIERIVVDQFAITAELHDDALTALKRLAGMTIVGQSARMSAERLDVLEAGHWESSASFDARAARLEVDEVWPDLPSDLVDAIRSGGFDAASSDPAAARSVAHRAYEQALSEFLSAVAQLVSAAATERVASRERSREAARARWSTA